MPQRLLVVAALVTVVAACQDDPFVAPLVTSTTERVLAYPNVVASAAAVLSIRALADDEFLRDLVEHVADRNIARQLRQSLAGLSAAAGTADGSAVMQALVTVRAEHMWQRTDAFHPDDELALQVFEMMLDHAEWVLTTPVETTEAPPTERANRSISN